MRLPLRLGLLLTGFAWCSSAEFRWIQLSFNGLDCASCAEFVQGKLSKNRGIESVEVDLKAGHVTVALKPENRVRLDQVRDFVQQSGFTPQEARVKLRGTAAKADS